ncbi:hypothetical protein [Neolewinella agarilytica]|uniref:Uncharacterized protein n=1 Tax=Neolewinella agarilytica TaxID=478744 RepID=A0A1H9NJQ9_9BACT|nr:hypothetical protein [Neolewinella agarilytica]SER36200.1 hypothetical protein SAMN05444359_13738 [Neolewinella agarilytica]
MNNLSNYRFTFRKVFASICAIVFPFFLFAQIANYPHYQKAIHQAEIQLVRGDKTKALSLYRDILSTSKGNFVKDVYNALLLAVELEDANAFFGHLDLLLPKGLPNEYLMEVEKFSAYRSDPRWSDFMERNRMDNGIDQPMRDTMKQIQRLDQLYRKKKGSYRVYGDTIAAIDSMHVDYLLGLLEAGRFPGEDEIGVVNLRGKQYYDIALLHYTQSVGVNPSRPKITPFLLNLVFEGKILPNKCAAWLESQNDGFEAGSRSTYSFIVEGKKTDFYFDKFSGRKLILLNQYRKLLHLESLEEYREKVKYVLLNPDSPFVFDVRFNTLESSKELFERLSSYMEKVE